jgi:hypothetical protein
MTGDDEGVGRARRGQAPSMHGIEHDLDPPDDAERFAEAPGIAELALLSTSKISVAAGGPELPGEIVLSWRASAPAFLPPEVDVTLVVPVDVIDELLDDLVRLRIGPID